MLKNLLLAKIYPFPTLFPTFSRPQTNQSLFAVLEDIMLNTNQLPIFSFKMHHRNLLVNPVYPSRTHLMSQNNGFQVSR